MNDDIRSQYPVLDRYTYLDTASSGLLNTRTTAWRRTYDQAFAMQGSSFRDGLIEELDGVRVTIGRVFGAKLEEVALVSSFSIGMNMIAESLPATARVLTLQGDYPSLTMPLQSRGFAIETVPMFDLSEAGIATRIHDLKIDILAMSMTQWISGITFDVAFFAKLKVDFPQLLIIVDGTQSIGTAPFDFANSGVDIMITSAYKWLGGGYGCGFLLCSDYGLSQLHIKYSGNATVMTRLLGAHNYPLQQLEPGHLDYLNMGSMKLGIEQLESIGLDEIQRYISKVSLHAKSMLVNMGFLPPTTLGGSIHRGIIHFISSQRLVDFLREQDILVSYRNGLRLSIHYYNTEDDINQLVRALRVFR